MNSDDMGTLTTLILTVKAICTSRGFNVLCISVDNAFTPMREDPTLIFSGMNLNITSMDEHEPFYQYPYDYAPHCAPKTSL